MGAGRMSTPRDFGGSMAFGQQSAEALGDPAWTSRRRPPSVSVSSVVGPARHDG